MLATNSQPTTQPSLFSHSPHWRRLECDRYHLDPKVSAAVSPRQGDGTDRERGREVSCLHYGEA